MAENKKKFKINFFDIVIILIVVCVGAGIYFFTHKSPAAATKKLTYGAEEAPKTGRIFTMRHPVVKKK